MQPHRRLPAEWEPHEATWLAWPHEVTDWPGKFAPIPWIYADIVRHLARVERVRILVEDTTAAEKARRILKKSGVDLRAVEFFEHRTDRSWTRDYCPLFVREAGGITATNWIFNGWAKYPNSENDNDVARFVANALGIPRIDIDIVLEGGSIDVNGAGLLLTTEECLLSPVQARNPGFSREQLEAIFREYLGVDRVIWLRNGIAGDDTHGHIDDLARFTNETTIVIASEDDPTDANYAPLRENLDLLRATDLNVETLPMPEPIWFDNQRLPASYANFYIANGIVLVPVFNDANDRLALNTLAPLFPGRDIIGIYSRDLVLGLGTLHCMSMQQPLA